MLALKEQAGSDIVMSAQPRWGPVNADHISQAALQATEQVSVLLSPLPRAQAKGNHQR